jgi:transglutaminase-like putative cysteine protease/uncharacterized membrane protein
MASASTSRPVLPAPIQRYFEFALYLMVLTAFGTLASTGGLDVATILLVGAALLFRGYLLAKRRHALIPERWTTLLTVGYIAYYLADYFLISGSFLNATVHLVLFVMVVRLFSSQRDRDYYFLAVISFLMVLAASVLTVDSTFLMAFGGFLLTAVVAFVLMEMRHAFHRASVHSSPSNPEATYRQMAFSLAGISPALVILIFLGAAAIFFVLPRVSSGYLSAYSPGGDISTGFSEEVQLGRIGQIQQSNALVMHVQVDGDTSGAYDLKWRGVALSLFDGKTWSNPHEQHLVQPGYRGRFILSQPDPAQLRQSLYHHQLIHYRVLMEPVATNVFFLAPSAITLEGNYRMIATDGAGAAFDLDSDHPIARYEATSDISRPGAGQLRVASSDYPAGIQLNYLQLPALDPRVARLAADITSLSTNDYDRALALETYLRTHFGYTLDLPRTVPRDPIANFLFERKQGHCEYFASSMAVMLRTLRIPSRVVNGFRSSEFNDLTSQYLVRASSAHSWVEVYFPDYGWISFDPTPSGPAQSQSRWGRAMLYLDALASFWREWIINYDVSHQYTLGRQATRASFELYQRVRAWARLEYDNLLDAARQSQQTMSRAPGRWSMSAVAAAVILILGANLGRLWRAFARRRLAAHPEDSPRQAATLWYQRMLAAVAKRGWRKTPAQTPKEFARAVPDSALRQRVAKFTEHYESARFGDSPDDARSLPELYEEIVETARK